MSILDQLGVQTRGLVETMTPFETWEGSSVQEWSVTLQMLNMGDLVEVARLTGNVSPLEMAYLTKVHLLARSLKMINNQEIVTSEELEDYNNSHNLAGNQTISLADYKILFIKQLSESVINRLVFLYDEMTNRYVAGLLGKSVIPPELDATKFDNSPDTTEKGEQTADDSDNSPTTS